MDFHLHHSKEKKEKSAYLLGKKTPIILKLNMRQSSIISNSNFIKWRKLGISIADTVLV